MPNDHYRLKKPCANCPFRNQGAISLAPGRLEGIIDTLLGDDYIYLPVSQNRSFPRGRRVG